MLLLNWNNKRFYKHGSLISKQIRDGLIGLNLYLDEPLEEMQSYFDDNGTNSFF